jgi:hypothetical protein
MGANEEHSRGVVLSLTRHSDIGYHLAEAEAWLAASEGGRRTTPLAYAAFELRLETERVALELLMRVRGDQLLREDVQTIRKFRRMQDRIYKLAGNQRVLDRKVAFYNVLLGAMQVPLRVHSVNLGELQRGWETCSAFCHIMFSLAAAIPDSNVGEVGFKEVTDVQRFVRSVVDSGVTWPQVHHPGFVALQHKYARGEIGDADVLEWVRARGLWGQTVHPDGRKEFFGVPIPPPAA